MTVRLFDTRTQTTIDLPAPPAPVGMYICGPTVYSRAHIGNARPFVFGMLLTRWLRHKGHEVTFVHNITDINDKIYAAADGEPSTQVAERAGQWYIEDIEAFGLGMPDRMPKVTETLPEIVDFVQQLIDAGKAYEVDGDVYFRIGSFEDYGVLSRQYGALTETEESNPLKENPLDFALWKATKPDEDASWPSPWGKGRPGWHIECSAMARRELGDAFAIHGGGLDLCFPHHENELAQSESLGLGFAGIWAHNGMLEFTGEKMSKSIGNLETIEEAHKRWGRGTLLMLFVSVHWRRSMDYSETTLRQAESRLRSLRKALTQDPQPHDESQWAEFAACLDDNFDTAKALVVLHRWADTGQVELLGRGLDLFGLLDDDADAADDAVPDEVTALAASRAEAKASRDFELADRLRDEVLELGWAIQDEPGGGFQLVRSDAATSR